MPARASIAIEIVRSAQSVKVRAFDFHRSSAQATRYIVPQTHSTLLVSFERVDRPQGCTLFSGALTYSHLAE